jgi:Flp pilus assembly pilin Flp
LAVILAIVAAFITVPFVVAALLVLGAIADITNTPEQNIRIFLITIVLLLGAKALGDIPVVGTWLSAIFSNIGTAVLGASIMAIVLGLYARVKSDWAPATT